MNWNQHLTVCTEVINRIDPLLPGSRVIGVRDGIIVALLEEPYQGNWHKITKLSPDDLRNGLAGEHWDIIGMKIRHLVRKGVLL